MMLKDVRDSSSLLLDAHYQRSHLETPGELGSS